MDALAASSSTSPSPTAPPASSSGCKPTGQTTGVTSKGRPLSFSGTHVALDGL